MFLLLSICANGAESSSVFRSFRANQPINQPINEWKVMNAIMNQMTEFGQRSFATEQMSLRDSGSSTADSSRGLNQPPARKTFRWSDQDFDRPCAVSSPLNEW